MCKSSMFPAAERVGQVSDIPARYNNACTRKAAELQ
jgi:hypothetical protein